jgi:hypothetical protein
MKAANCASRRRRLQCGVYIAASSGAIALLSCHFASSVEAPTLAERAMAAIWYILLSGGSSVLFRRCYLADAWLPSLSGGATMFATSMLVYSLVRGEVVLLPLPALFVLPATAIAAAAPARKRRSGDVRPSPFEDQQDSASAS